MMYHDVSLKWIIAIVAATAGIVLRCADLGPVAGTVTQSGNGFVSGAVVDEGNPVPGARVLLVPAQYDPNSGVALPDSLTTTTDDSGAFCITAPRSYGYNVEVEHSSGKNALHFGISFSTGDSQSTGLLNLTIPGSIKVFLPDAAASSAAYVYLPGTTFFCPLHGDTALLNGIPAGVIPKLAYRPAGAGSGERIVKTGIVVASGETTSIAVFSSWKYSLRLYLNTTASGASVASDVTNFPALIRLTSSNFDFSLAKSRGEDVRFSKSDGTSLPFEIERWDAGGQVAEIWVKVDTVRGNDSTQSITMYWGNPNASGTSNGGAVFDTSNGFLGVWHLNQKCDDVTYGGNSGTNYGTTDTTGIIGYCKKFDGSDSIKIAGLLGSPASITLSAWAQLDTVPEGRYGGEVLTIGDAVLIRMDFSVLDLGTYGAIHPYGDSVYYNVSSGQFLKQTGWHLVTFTIDQNNHTQTLYIDGSSVRAGDSVISIDYSRVGQNTFIGTHGNGSAEYDFSGRIDEVRVYRKSISADYVKLSFMNQRQDDRLVTIESLPEVQ